MLVPEISTGERIKLMTANQIAFWKYQEDQRHNREMETETKRANQEKEAISRQEITSKEGIERAKNLTNRAKIEGEYGQTYATQFSGDDAYIKGQDRLTGNTAIHVLTQEVPSILNPLAGVLKSLF